MRGLESGLRIWPNGAGIGVFVRSVHNLARTALEAACSKASRPYRLSQLDGISTH
jgi:hypothetical protein